MSGSNVPEHDDPRVVLITAPDEAVARSIATTLVEERLLACANLVPGVTSIYRWEGAVEEAREVLVLGKTRAGHLPRLEARLAALHPYDVPECVALDPARVEGRYRAWLLAATEPE